LLSNRDRLAALNYLCAFTQAVAHCGNRLSVDKNRTAASYDFAHVWYAFVAGWFLMYCAGITVAGYWTPVNKHIRRPGRNGISAAMYSSGVTLSCYCWHSILS